MKYLVNVRTAVGRLSTASIEARSAVEALIEGLRKAEVKDIRYGSITAIVDPVLKEVEKRHE